MDSVYQFDDNFTLTVSDSASNRPPAWASGLVAEDVGDGIHVHRYDFVTETDHHLFGAGPAMLCVAVVMDGRGTMAIEGGPPLQVTPGTTVIFHAPYAVRGEHRVVAGTHTRCLDLRLSPAAVEWLGIREPAGLARGCAADCSVGDVLLLGRPTSTRLAALAQEIFSCRYVGSPRRLYLRAKVLEALAHVTADAREPDPSAQQLSRRDRDRIKAAQQLLATRYGERWTIAALAREVGLNERKLKLGFRLALGRTVIAYLEDQRLAAAAALLAGEGVSVTDVAYSVGYCNLSYFAKRFQNRYGLPPREWRRRSA